MNRRKRKAILKRCVAVFLALALATMAVLFFTSGTRQPEPKQTMTYTVQKGDTLYDLAAQFGIQDWRKWSFEVCEINGLEQGGLLPIGQDIVIWH